MAAQKRQFEELARMFHVLASSPRLSILRMLQDGDMNVTHICKKLKAHQPTVSRHLGILRMAGLVSARRSGKEIFYSLKDLRMDAYTRGMRSLLARADVLRIGPIVVGVTKS